MSSIVHWFRRDLRVRDNTALFHAARDGDGVVAVFVLDDHYLSDSDAAATNGTVGMGTADVGPARFRFLRESLEALAASVARRGGRLLLRRGPAAEALPRLLAETGARAVYANAEIGPYPESRDAAVREALFSRGARLRLFQDSLLVDPERMATDAGDPYTVYTPFARRWSCEEKTPPLPEPASLDGPPAASVAIDRVLAWRDLGPDPSAPKGGEDEALRLLERFGRGPISRYAEDRNRPELPGPRGCLRISTSDDLAADGSRRRLRGCRERDRAARPSSGSGSSPGRSLPLDPLPLPSRGPRELSPRARRPRVARRCRATVCVEGRRDGIPLVDAAMRELATTHWMHNRARMVAASFLTKDLHVHWREGERWFEHELADADQANNNGGWQWAAGTGTDAAPFFRIFNPVLQSRRFDPQGKYTRRYVPALSRVPDARIHEPWIMSAAEQDAFGCRIGRDYPAPIVDHAAERRVALDMWEAIKKGA